MQYAVIIERVADSYSAYVPDLPGCVLIGETREEVERRIRGLIELHLDSMRQRGCPIPKPTSFAITVDVPD